MTKICCNCKFEKEDLEFGKDKRSPSGLKSRCKECEKLYAKEYNAKNREQIKEYNKNYNIENRENIAKRKKKYYDENTEICLERSYNYRKNNLDKHAARMKLWRKENTEKAKEISRRCWWNNRENRIKQSRAYYENHKEEAKERNSKYRKENIDKILKQNRDRKIKKANIEGFHTLEQWNILCNFFNNICPKCGEQKKFTVDHIIPLNDNNATDWIDNIQPLCIHCNSSKNSILIIDYRPKEVREWAMKEVQNDKSNC